MSDLLTAAGKLLERAAEHATLGDPPGAAEDRAIADLHAEIAAHDRSEDPHEWETCFIAVRSAAEDLAAAINHTGKD